MLPRSNVDFPRFNIIVEDLDNFRTQRFVLVTLRKLLEIVFLGFLVAVEAEDAAPLVDVGVVG